MYQREKKKVGHITRCIGIQSNVSTSFLVYQYFVLPLRLLGLIAMCLKKHRKSIMSFIIRGCWLLAQPQRNRIRTWTKSLLFLPVFPLLTQFCLGSTLICNDTLQVSFCQSVFNFWAQIVQVLLESFLFSEVVNNNKAFPSSREQLYDNQVKMECVSSSRTCVFVFVCASLAKALHIQDQVNKYTRKIVSAFSCRVYQISSLLFLHLALTYFRCGVHYVVAFLCPKAFSFISQMYCLHALHSSMCSIPTFSPTLQEFA